MTETPADLSGFVTSLTGTDGINAGNLWGAVTALAPIIVTAVLFAFGYRMARRLLKGLSKGKSGA